MFAIFKISSILTSVRNTMLNDFLGLVAFESGSGVPSFMPHRIKTVRLFYRHWKADIAPQKPSLLLALIVLSILMSLSFINTCRNYARQPKRAHLTTTFQPTPWHPSTWITPCDMWSSFTPLLPILIYNCFSNISIRIVTYRDFAKKPFSTTAEGLKNFKH